MEIVTGSLRDLIITYGPFDEKITSMFMYQIIKGLTYIHEQKIIHRDLKCANILVNHDSTIKISDFGAAKELENSVSDVNYE